METGKYKVVAIAGTFDRLHKGHKFFIQQAFKYGGKVVIGLMSDKYCGNIKNQAINITKFQDRKAELAKYLKNKNLQDRVLIISIDDVYGPATEKNEIEALVVTRDTLKGGREVNRKRRELGVKPLHLVIVKLEKSADRRKISSTRIRLGEIDRWGNLYYKNLSFKGKIPEEMRLKLKKPAGILLKGNPDNPEQLAPAVQDQLEKIDPIVTITVGDEVTKLINFIDQQSTLSIFDYKVNRLKKYHSLEDLGIDKEAVFSTVRNPAGTISKTLVEAVRHRLKELVLSEQNQLIRIIGEDDLAALVAMLLSPLESVVIYGQPGEGIVITEISEDKKNQLMKLISEYY